MDTNAGEELRHLQKLFFEFIQRLEEFDEKRILDPNGYSDFVRLAESIAEIQVKHGMPKFLKCELRELPTKFKVVTKDRVGVPRELLKLRVWDPYSDKKGITTAIPKGGTLPNGAPPGNENSIRTVVDYLKRSARFVQHEYELNPTGPSPQQIVILIHGIRTFANWQPMVKRVLEEIPNTRVITIKYGYLDALRFWFPFFTRQQPIADVQREIQNAQRANPGARVSIIAHSFGTYAISRILRETPNLNIERLILSGSIVPRSYRWDYVDSRLATDVLNDYGTRDIWPVLAKCLSWGYGDTGRHGFGRGATVRDRGHDYSHGQFFNEEFVRTYWKPWLEKNEFIPSEWEEKSPPPAWWLSILSVLPIQWLGLATVVAALVLIFAIVRLPGPSNSHVTGGSRASEIPSFPQDQDRPRRQESFTRSAGLELRLIQGGSFRMGSKTGFDSEKPVHEVSVGTFELGVYEVTLEQYEIVLKVNPSNFPARQLPVTNVSWFEAIRFCNALSDLERLPRYYNIQGTEVTIIDQQSFGYRLPTEAEWEYACRAGNQSDYCFGNDVNELDSYAWFSKSDTPRPIGEKLPNEWGLYDMHGNVFEWCWDFYDEHYYVSSPRDNPTGPDSGTRRVTRGGSFDKAYGEQMSARYCRCAHRSGFSPTDKWDNLGFRVARTSVQIGGPVTAH